MKNALLKAKKLMIEGQEKLAHLIADHIYEEVPKNGPSDFFMGKAQDHRNESKSLS